MSGLYPDLGVHGLVKGLHINFNENDLPSPPPPLQGNLTDSVS